MVWCQRAAVRGMAVALSSQAAVGGASQSSPPGVVVGGAGMLQRQQRQAQGHSTQVVQLTLSGWSRCLATWAKRSSKAASMPLLGQVGGV